MTEGRPHELSGTVDGGLALKWPMGQRSKAVRKLSEVDPGIAAVAALSLAVAVQHPVGSTVFALAGLALVAIALRSGTVEMDAKALFRLAGLTGTAALLLRMRISGVQSLAEATYLVVSLSCLATGAVFGSRRRVRRLAVGLGLAAVALGALIIAVQWWEADRGADVYLAHLAAGSALAESENPYTAAVRVPDSSPYAVPGHIIEGYNYPPVILVTYGALAIVTDPRLISIVSWFFVIGWIGTVALRSGPRSDPAFAVFLLLASLPAWSTILFVGWSEPLSAALLLGAGLLWKRRWRLGTVALGVALASKQYFIALAPLVLIQTEWKLGRRLAILGIAAGTVLAGLAVFGTENLYNALVADLLRVPFRPDTQSLPGLLYALGVPAEIPRTVTLIVAPLAALVWARRSPGYDQFLLRGALILGAVFIAAVALLNYWLMVLLMVAIGRVGVESEGTQR